MKIKLDEKYGQVVKRFFEKNRGISHQVSLEKGDLVLVVDSHSLPARQARQIQLYFKYVDLFEWYQGGVEDVIFWERPEKFDRIAADFLGLTQDLSYDLIAPIEARGYLLAGILASHVKEPILLVRKYKRFYDRFPGVKVPFSNWKGEDEAIFIFKKARFSGKRIMVVDDLIETGNSLEATVTGLEAVGCQPVGAFYLCDVMNEQRRRDFSIPIRSLVNSSLT